MLRGMYSSVSAMINLEKKQSVITNNIANVNTIGFKSEKLISKSFDEVLLSNNDNYIGGKSFSQDVGKLSLGVNIDENITNYSQGTFIESNNKTDFAINGKGFFNIRDFSGNIFYSRDGVFKVNSQGYLVTSAGHYVMGKNQSTGNEEPIYIGNSKVIIDQKNNLLLDGDISYSFKITDFNNYEVLNKVGENLYYGQGGFDINQVSIKQGFKEGSNVDIISETSELMSNLRAFEANQKIVQTIDSTLIKIANEIGNVR